MTRFNIATPKTYKDKNGNEKTAWLNVGTMAYFEPTDQKDGSFIIELNLLPGVIFRAFEQKPKEERSKPDYDNLPQWEKSNFELGINKTSAGTNQYMKPMPGGSGNYS